VGIFSQLDTQQSDSNIDLSAPVPTSRSIRLPCSVPNRELPRALLLPLGRVAALSFSQATQFGFNFGVRNFIQLIMGA
jgi:hypothetical protein